ncbi:MAG: NADH-quinone oxidoreductase subunit N [Gemmatimonas sp.]
MNSQLTLTAMLPEHLLLLGIVVVLGLEIFGAAKRAALLAATLAVAASAGVALWLCSSGFSGIPFPGQFSVAHDSLVAKSIVLVLTVPVLLMARDDFEGSDFPALILSSLYGVCLLISSDSFLTMFLGLELMSLPVYTLVLLAYQREQSAEAALKYLVLGGAATAMFLMGVSLLFGITRSTEIGTFANALIAPDIMSRAAVALILLAFFLKGAVVPFHAWAPDAYEGASIPVTAYMSTIVKAGVMFAVVRLFADVPLMSPVREIVGIFPLISIVWGNIAAMRQQSFRRMMGYSSIAHAGYLFYALLGAGEGQMEAVTFYVLTYGVLNLLAFAAIPPHADDAARDRLDTLKGLWHRNPFAATMIAIAMLSLAGLPPFPGFVAKFLVFKNVLAAGFTTYAVVGLVGSYIGIYFYLRVIQTMFMGADEAERASVMRTNGFAHFAAMLCLTFTLALMFFPGRALAGI